MEAEQIMDFPWIVLRDDVIWLMVKVTDYES